MKKKKEKLIKVKWFIKDLMKSMILENLKQYMFLVMKLKIILLMSIANGEQNHLSKHITEFKSKTRPQDCKSKN